MAPGRRATDDMHSVTLMRGRLVEVLRAAAVAAGAEVRLGERMTGAVQDADGVIVEFASGSTDRADALIGAADIRSVL
ncbi:FAD-dependent oxidoreductase [Glycomyces mayteni]|uniref:FAD-dependent oxidoreductase n=1 Tax=Glycomyces mayteni TaxID=543887 RepID=A0ABW2DFP6_9ACTN